MIDWRARTKGHVLGLLALVAVGAALVAHGSVGERCPGTDVGGSYRAHGGEIQLELAHACATGRVRGVLEDAHRYRYELRGEVRDGELRFSAFRRGTDGETLVIFSNGLDIVGGGRSLHGQLQRAGTGLQTSTAITLSRQSDTDEAATRG